MLCFCFPFGYFCDKKEKKGKLMNKWLIIVVIVLLAVIGAMWEQVKFANKRWETAEANVKAYSQSLSKEGQRNAALQLSVDQLENMKDSVLQELDRTRKDLKVKNKNLKAVQYVGSVFTRVDTIQVTQVDTLFREASLAVDTVIGDSWYNVRLGLRYPSMITVKPYFKSEKHIVVSSKKETVNPPKKFFLLRWFQKKRTVIHVDIVEKNPYVNNQTSRYIEVIK